MHLKIKLKYLLKIIILLIWILIFYLQFERPFITHIAQNISPSLLLSSFRHTFFWLIWLFVPLIVLAIFKGRFFCWHICPVGLAQEILPSVHNTKNSKFNLYLFILLLSCSLFGLNIIALLDPIVIINRAVAAIKMRFLALIFFFIPITLIFLLSIYKKRTWCFKLCPLGAIFDWILIIRQKKKFDLNKRNTLIAIASGLTLGLILKAKNYIWSKEIDNRLLRPPGALLEDKFTEKCIRCGSCISVCITGTLTPALFEAGLEGLFTPKLVPQIAECDEFCNKCGQACPTGAIKNMPLDIKRNFKIGTAEIDRSKCIAWADNSLCLICQEFCPYLSIKVVRNEHGTPCPVMISEICRGCGICENNCPAVPIRAIKVFNTGAGTIIQDKNS